ncbi:hypothetical protein RhiirC2_857614 [Rhizophagus irregularis]|uniref:Uncharacterized protein n=1 Tax=Rhizophagus irregularis TaxID=588596 RepID=A0A2N1MB11_9GLOM|nr:hypothetical protein RhiirC2_857614 [Rhizophagus irregularis]
MRTSAVFLVFLDANLGDSLNSLWIWDSELPILFGNRNECPSLVEIEDLSIGYVEFWGEIRQYFLMFLYIFLTNHFLIFWGFSFF